MIGCSICGRVAAFVSPLKRCRKLMLGFYGALSLRPQSAEPRLKLSTLKLAPDFSVSIGGKFYGFAFANRLCAYAGPVFRSGKWLIKRLL